MDYLYNIFIIYMSSYYTLPESFPGGAEYFYANNVLPLFNEMIDTDVHKLNKKQKSELYAIMMGDDAPALKWDSSKQYKFLDTVSKKSKFPGQRQVTPIDNALDVSHFLTHDEIKEVRDLLKKIRNVGGRRKRKRKRSRGTKKKRRKRNSKKRTRRRRRKRRR